MKRGKLSAEVRAFLKDHADELNKLSQHYPKLIVYDEVQECLNANWRFLLSGELGCLQNIAEKLLIHLYILSEKKVGAWMIGHWSRIQGKDMSRHTVFTVDSPYSFTTREYAADYLRQTISRKGQYSILQIGQIINAR